MGSNLPKFRVAIGENIGNELFFLFPDLSAEQRTYLTSDIASGVTSLPADGVNFSANQYVLIGQPGNIGSEIVKISGSPTSTAITVGATSFAHNRGDIVRFIPFNQIVAEWATSATGSFTALSAINIRADSTETYLQQASDPTTYWYRFRFFNSTSSNYSIYSDIIAATGYGDNTIWSIKLRALRQIGEDYSDLITDQDLNDWLQEARRQADQNPAVFRWSFRTTFNNTTGQMLAGQWRVAVPANLRDPNSNKNMLSVRVANQNRPAIYQDRRRFNQNYLNIQHSTLQSSASFNATSLVLANSSDFATAGAVTVANNNIGDGLIVLSYTGNNKVTNTLSGVTGTYGPVTARNIYRTKAGGSVFYLLTTLFDNSTTTFTDNVADNALGASSPPTTQGMNTIQPPASGPSAAAGSTGVLTGAYQYVVTYVAIGGETMASVTGSVTVTTKQVSLTSIPTATNRTILAGTDVWQNSGSASIPFGLPTAYTMGGDGYIYFDMPLKIDYDGMNVKDDHYNIIPQILTDDQTFDEPFYDLYVSWLKWKVKYKKANGKIDRDGDPDYKDWLTGLGNLIGQEFPSQRVSFVPDIEGFLSATE